ncbi:MAG: glycosyltransferase family 2 protein [Planctomycetota bacterium]
MLSIVVPIYNEQENLPELSRRLQEACDATGLTWEVLFVDDGSADGSGEVLEALHESDPRMKVLTLSRNFGHQPAVSAGLAEATGEAVVLIDGDLQDPPELIPELVQRWREGADVVLAERRSRADASMRNPLRALGFRLFYPVFRRVSDLPTTPDAGIFGLMDRKVVDELNAMPERSRFIPGLRAWLGFRTATVHYDRADRAAGAPKQTLYRLAKYAADGMFSFSTKPLKLATLLGFLVSLGSLWLAAYYAVSKWINDKPTDGFTTTIVVVLFLGGVQLITVGILGEYIGRIYEEVKQRPLYVIRRKLGVGDQPPRPVVRREVETSER